MNRAIKKAEQEYNSLFDNFTSDTEMETAAKKIAKKHNLIWDWCENWGWTGAVVFSNKIETR